MVAKMTFQTWWEGYWKSKDVVPVLQLAMREIAESAWNAAIKATDSVSGHEARDQTVEKE